MLEAQSELVKQPTDPATKIGAKLTMTKIFPDKYFLLIIKRCDRFAIGSCSGDAAIIEIFVSEIRRVVGEVTSDIYYWTEGPGQNYRRQNGVHDIFVSIAMPKQCKTRKLESTQNIESQSEYKK